MILPFSVEQFIGIFRVYNQTIWPLQIIGYLAGLFILFTLFKPKPAFNRINAAILTCYWLIMGIGYHWFFFSRINRPAFAFGLFFVIQALLFLIFGVIATRLSFGIDKLDLFSIFGLLAVAYGMFIYPALGFVFGHVFPNAPVFGVAPCPTTIFTLGMLLLTRNKVPKYLLIIPVLWSFVGFMAAISLGVKEDIGLLVTGIVVTVLLVVRDKGKSRDKATAM